MISDKKKRMINLYILLHKGAVVIMLLTSLAIYLSSLGSDGIGYVFFAIGFPLAALVKLASMLIAYANYSYRCPRCGEQFFKHHYLREGSMKEQFYQCSHCSLSIDDIDAYMKRVE